MSPNKKLFYAFLILGTILLVLRLPTLFELPATDQALSAYIGQKMQEGQLLYRDLWEHRPPGIYFLYSWISSLGLERDLYWIIPFFDTLYTLLTMGAILLLARSFWGLGPAWGAAFIFTLFSLSPVSQGAWSRIQPEMLMNLPLILCFYGGYQGFCQQKKWPWFFFGLALGAAFIIKFTALLLALPLIPLLWNSPSTANPIKNFRLKKIFYLILGLMIPIFITILYLYVKGILPEAYEALVVYNRVYSAFRMELKLASSLLLEKWQGQIIFPLAVLFLALLGLRRERLYHSLLGRIMILWILIALFSVFIQGKYLASHFLSLIPPLSLLAGFSWEWLKKPRAGKYSPVISLLILALLAGAAGDAFKGYLRYYRTGFTFLLKKVGYEEALRSLPANAKKLGLWELGRAIAQNSQEKDYIYVWAVAPEIYYYSNRPAPNRFILEHYLLDAQNSLSRGLPGIKTRQQELLKNLKEKPVKFFLVGLKDLSIFEPKDSLSQLNDFPELYQWVQDNYFLLTQNDHYLLYQRKPPGI